MDSIGVSLQDTDNSLKAGVGGPTLLEDFHNREKSAFHTPAHLSRLICTDPPSFATQFLPSTTSEFPSESSTPEEPPHTVPSSSTRPSPSSPRPAS